MTLSEITSYAGIINTLVAVLTLIIAIIVYRNWRNQQTYSIKLNLILDLEDKLDIYIYWCLIDFNTFFQADRCIAKGRNDGYSDKDIDNTIRKHFEEKLDTERTEKNRYEFELSLLRASRLIPEIDFGHNLIKSIEALQKEYITNSQHCDNLDEYVEKITKIKNIHMDKLKNYKAANKMV